MDELQNLEQLLNELLSGIQAVVQSGEKLPDEIQGTIAEELNFLTSKIDELRSAEVPVIPDIPSAPFDSAVVNGFRYNPKNGDLFVKFQDKFPGTNGSQYVYKNVEPYIFDIFKRGAVAPKTSGKNEWNSWHAGRTPSHGASLNALLKGGGYPVVKLT